MRQWLDRDVFVAQLDDWVVGHYQVQGVRLPASDGYAEFGPWSWLLKSGGKAWGAAGVARGSVEVKARGYARVRLPSGLRREDAHRFYRALGVKVNRASYAFELVDAALLLQTA